MLERKGSRREVSGTVGEKRQFMKGGVGIHNHPEGGTFSLPDLRDFGFGARQIVVASPEGTYRLTNVKYGTKEQYDGWYNMQEAMKAAGVDKEMSTLEIRDRARSTPAVARQLEAIRRTSSQWAKAKDAGKPKEVLDRFVERYNRQSEKYKELLHAAERKVEVQPYHDFYRKHAKEYGFAYTFTKA